MISRSAWLALSLTIAGLALPGLSSAADAVRGEKLAYTCHGCHGIPNYKNAYPNYSVPKLGGQHAEYIMAALAEYEAKARWHPTMQGLATTLPAQDKADIAAFFQAEPVVSSGETIGTPPAVVQTCAACHGTDGVGILPEYPNLAGQHEDYLQNALKSYRSGQRKNAVMGGMAAALTDADIRELAGYYSSQRPGLCATDETRDQGKCKGL